MEFDEHWGDPEGHKGNCATCKEREWISVKDRLPEEGVQVLTIDASIKEYHEYRLDYIVCCPNETFWARRLVRENHKVTHWMPVQLPPQE